MNVEMIPLADIEVGRRLRAVDMDQAAMIAASIEEHGQRTPVEVRASKKGSPRPWHLIAGAHRMAALDMLGITEVAAVILKADDIEAELLEIDENLCRHELTPLDRATFLARRKEVYEELYPETKHGGDRKSDQARMLTRLIPSFTDATAQKLGLDSSTIRRAVSLYTGIAQDVRENISGTWVAASGAQLGALARLTPDMQRRVASAVHEFPTLTSVAAILAEIQGTERTPPATRFERFLALWRKMDAREHQQVIEYLAPSLPGAVSREAA